MSDDAIHIRSLTDGNHTMCGEPMWRVWNAVGFGSPRPDPGSGCWTCIQKAERIDKILSLRYPDGDK